MINNSSSSFTSNTSFGAPPAFALKAKKTRTLTVSTIDHTYRDLSCLKIESLYDANRKSKNFPAKLHLICSNPEYAHIITWLSFTTLYMQTTWKELGARQQGVVVQCCSSQVLQPQQVR
eukprot:scaffold1851_cov172-Alexandrium_tamarense.AAC.1